MELVQISPLRQAPAPKPEWLRARAPVGENYHNQKVLARSLGLHTVCESDLHDAGQSVYAALRVLRGAQGAS